MSGWARNGHGSGEDQPLDDAAVEELLSGDYAGGDPKLVAMSQFFEQVRSVAERPVPPPSADLEPFLAGWPRAGDGDVRASGRPPVGRALRRWGAAAAGHRSLSVHVAAAAVVVLLAAALVALGSARRLPGPIQAVAAKMVRTVTPFEFPEEGKPGAVASRAPGTEPARPSDDEPDSAGGDSSRGPGAEPGADGRLPTGGDDSGRRSPPSGVDVVPTPSTVSPPQAAPAAPEARQGRPSGGPADANPPPVGRQPGLSADLVGAAGSETAGDADGRGTAVLDANRGRNELCLTVVVSGTAPVTAAHVHAGPIGADGPPVATFTGIPETRACVIADDDLVKRIRQQPRDYHVDVHTTEFPNGALRGQLTK